MNQLIEYIGHHSLLAASALALAIVVAVFEWRHRATLQSSVPPQDAVRLMNHGALVLDIRPQEEFATGHLNGAKHLSSDKILNAGETMKKYKEKPVLVYCSNGSLSAAAVRQLLAQGFTQACNLRGGLVSWRAENLPLAKG